MYTLFVFTSIRADRYIDKLVFSDLADAQQYKVEQELLGRWCWIKAN